MRAAFALALCATAGCAVVHAPEAHRAEPVGADAFCGVYAAILCDGVAGCCPSSELPSRDACISLLGAYCARVLVPLLGDGRTGYDPVEAGHQLAVARRMVDTCDPAIVRWQNADDGLTAPLRGTVAEGELCNPLFPERFAEGELDVPRFYSCVGDLACRPTTSLMEWRCLARASAGGACFGFADCAEPLACVLTMPTRAECVERLSPGAPCGADVQCASFDCDCRTDPCRCGPAGSAQDVYCALLR
ncbi:MAG: hypothetical protein KF729_02195 [Sandaracinaceae bacterium]|nr:hypothetical protein [Sandaracinaceae bacterium]